MKGFILAAGLGSRLKPWTDYHPKALVEVDGETMLSRVTRKMRRSGIDDITVNIHHYGEQIVDYNKEHGLGLNISDERGELLETGGALIHAQPYLQGAGSILIHNADILSNADLNALIKAHLESGADATLLVNNRDSSRKLMFNGDDLLIGWHSYANDEYRPLECRDAEAVERAFTGIYVIKESIITDMVERGWHGKFSIIDYLLSSMEDKRYMQHVQDGLRVLDIGKPEALSRACNFVKSVQNFDAP